MNAKEYIHAHPGIRPGHRAYGCALAVSKSGRRIIRQLSPCVVELCSFDKQIEEQWYRNGSAVINYMVPVKSDGALDWKHIISVHQEGACLADDSHELIQNIINVVDTARHHIWQLQKQMNKTSDRMLALQISYTTDAASALPPLGGRP